MTKREKYVNEILDIIGNGEVLAVEKNTHKPVACDDLQGCEDCLFYDREHEKCENRKWWLNSEYVDYTVDWSKVAVDTPILVSDNQDFENMERRHFCKYKNGEIYAFETGMTSWTTNVSCSWKYAKLATESDLKGE